MKTWAKSHQPGSQIKPAALVKYRTIYLLNTFGSLSDGINKGCGSRPCASTHTIVKTGCAAVAYKGAGRANSGCLALGTSKISSGILRMKNSASMTRKILGAVRLALLPVVLALTACQTDGTGPSAADGKPMTRTRAASECWMRTEKANPYQDLDKRADVVNKCIDDKLKAAGAAAPKT